MTQRWFLVLSSWMPMIARVMVTVKTVASHDDMKYR